MLYDATVSTGYRLGGLNPPIQPWCSVKFAPSYGPDWVINYELGAKASLFDGRTTIDGSVFHMQWRHMQTDLNGGGSWDCFTYIVNVGTAASDGFDLSTETALGESVRLGLAAAYTHARYTRRSWTVIRSGARRGHRGLNPRRALAVEHHRLRRIYPGADGSLPRFAGRGGIFHSRNNGPFYSLDPQSPNYDPGKTPDPSNNLLNLRASLAWSRLEWRLFLDNALISSRHSCAATPTSARRSLWQRPSGRAPGTSLVWQY